MVNYRNLHCQLRTNFIKFDRGFDGNYITYYFDDEMEKDIVALRALLYTWFDFYKTPILSVNTSIRQLLKLTGIKGSPNRYKSFKAYEQLKTCIQWFIDHEYLKLTDGESLDDFKFKESITIQLIEENYYLSVKDESSKADEPFISIPFDIFIKIESAQNVNTARMFYIFAYIKACCGFRFRGQSVAEYPKAAILPQRLMVRRTGFTRQSIIDYTNALCELEVIHRRQLPKTDGVHQASYVYVVDEDGWEEELKYGYDKYSLECELE